MASERWQSNPFGGGDDINLMQASQFFFFYAPRLSFFFTATDDNATASETHCSSTSEDRSSRFRVARHKAGRSVLDDE